MVICPSCQARNADHSTFCVRCGGALDNPPQQRDPGGNTDAMLVVPEATPAALVDRAATQLAEGRLPEALADCRRAIALEPGNAEAHAVLGMAYEQQGDLAAALEAYEAVLALDPERTVERQKANLLRLRVEGGQAIAPPTAACPSPGRVLWDRVTANPPLAMAIAAAMVVFLIGSIVLAHAGRAAQRRAAVIAAVTAGDQAYNAGQYAEAVKQYAYAYNLQPGDEGVRQRWEQAYQLCMTPPTHVAPGPQLPKYVPSPGPNPFEPVRIGGNAPPAPTQAALPPPAVPAAPPRAYDYDRWQGQMPRPTQPPSPVTPITPASGNRSQQVRGGNPITPVPSPKSTTKNPPSAPAGDDTPRTSKGDITIWASENQPQRPAGGGGGGGRSGEADALRAHAEQLANQGRHEEAITELRRAADAYEDAGRRDPGSAAVNSQAAQTCRARIEVLRMSP